ncbi:GNAT family N-acetyltransferase [Streptococcus cuniculi]|uniref:GNAT family N-acetyltransferase n=1 Tax=Streptococcus cuniculi TaxID=1432788 RepID=A0A1Q8E6B6_9STRE|nr:GNAT family protein [Streptococcus cuniculi]OLF47343.1 GNAT family N-acetyltransferase [Streptococcus cuniculi]
MRLLSQLHGPASSAQHWTYLSITPFTERNDFHQYLADMMASTDPYYLTIIDKASNRAVGTFALMRIDTKNRVIEMGWVIYSDELQQTRQATEAQYLVMKYVFETLKYRRYEWKCDHLNQPSRQAAKRLGFTYEGTFRQAVVYKGRNRDTDWFSLLDKEWPDKKQALEQWLADSNFDADGQQLTRLSQLHTNANPL